MEIKGDKVYSQDPFYDATIGGYIKPHDLLEDQKLADKVEEALELVEDFLDVVVEEEY